MLRRHVTAVLLAVFAGLAAAGALRASGREEDAARVRLTVLAAASLTEVFPRIDRRPRYTFAGSNQLAFQLRQGARADVFASASPQSAQALFRDRLVERPRGFAANVLVLVVPRSNPARLRSVFDLARRTRVRLVVAAPRVPAGAYAERVLGRLGLSSVLAKVVSREPDVKSVVGKVALGEADAGFVYRTDVRPVRRRVKAIALPARAQPQVRYEAAVVRSGANRLEARRFVTKLVRDPRARRVLRRAGFREP